MIIETAILWIGGAVLGGTALTIGLTPNLRNRFAMLFKSRTGHAINQLTDPMQALEQELAECQTKERELEKMVASIIATTRLQVVELSKLQEDYDKQEAKCEKYLGSDEVSAETQQELAENFAIAESALEAQKQNVSNLEKSEKDAREKLAQVRLQIKQANARKEGARSKYQVAKATAKSNEITRAVGSIDGNTSKIDNHVRKIDEMAAQQAAEHELLQGSPAEQELKKIEKSQRVDDVMARIKAKKAQEAAQPLTIKVVETEKEPRQ